MSVQTHWLSCDGHMKASLAAAMCGLVPMPVNSSFIQLLPPATPFQNSLSLWLLAGWTRDHVQPQRAEHMMGHQLHCLFCPFFSWPSSHRPCTPAGEWRPTGIQCSWPTFRVSQSIKHPEHLQPEHGAPVHDDCCRYSWLRGSLRIKGFLTRPRFKVFRLVNSQGLTYLAVRHKWEEQLLAVPVNTC